MQIFELKNEIFKEKIYDGITLEFLEEKLQYITLNKAQHASYFKIIEKVHTVGALHKVRNYYYAT